MSNLFDVGDPKLGAEVGSAMSGASEMNVRKTLVDDRCIPDLQRKQRLVDLYLFVIDFCLKAGTGNWWRRAVSLPFADMILGAEQVKELCLHELLYGAGDITTLCRAYELLEEDDHLTGDGDGQFLLDLLRFLRPNAGLKKRSNLRRRLGKKRARTSISLIVPDEQAFANLKEMCLPSLDSEGALAWLCEVRDVTLLVSARQSHLGELMAFLEEKRSDWCVVGQAFPDSLGDRLVGEGLRRDWLTGAMESHHLTEAGGQDADFMSINPDGVYAAGYLRGLLRVAEHNTAILTVPLWVNNRGLIDRVMGRIRAEDPAIISPTDLMDLACDIAAPSGGCIFSEGGGPGRGPTAHQMAIWVDGDRLEIHSTRHEIAFLSADRLRAMPQRFFARPSADLERLLAPGPTPHFVTATDDIAMCVFGHPPGAFFALGQEGGGVQRLVGPMKERTASAFFHRPVSLPISPRNTPDPPRADEVRKAFLAILDGEPHSLKIDQVLTALSVLHQYEMSEYGPANMAMALDEGRRLIDLSPSEGADVAAYERKALIRAALNFDHVDKALALAGQGGESTSFIREFLSKMVELRAENLKKGRRVRRKFFYRRSFAVLGSIVWGDSFVDKFVKYHLPSLLAKGNIPGLGRSRKVIHSIVTTEADKELIVASPVFAQLAKHAEVLFTCFPKEFLAKRENHQYPFYHFYGLLDHQNVFLAAALRAELYLLPPDIVLSQHSLSNLARRLGKGAAACSIAGMECDPVRLRQWLDAQSRGPAGELELASDDLLNFSVAEPDAYARSLIMNRENVSFCAHPRELAWPEPGGLSVHSIFMHPVALSSRLMSRPFSPQYENVDYALLPRLLRNDEELEVIEDANEMAVAQFGAPAAREEFLDGAFSIEAFVEAHRYNYAAHRRCFVKRQFFTAKALPYAVSENHDVEVARIVEALKRYRFTSSGVT